MPHALQSAPGGVPQRSPKFDEVVIISSFPPKTTNGTERNGSKDIFKMNEPESVITRSRAWRARARDASETLQKMRPETPSGLDKWNGRRPI